MSSMRAGLRRPLVGTRAASALGIALALAVALAGVNQVWTLATASSVLSFYASIALVTCAIALTIALGEIDLSVSAMAAAAGAVAVRTGADPLVGLIAALAFGAAVGAIQGFAVAWMRINSVAVSLGGLIALTGASAALTAGATITYPNYGPSAFLNRSLLGVATPAVLIGAGITLLITAFLLTTRPGRDLYAVGSNRGAAIAAGVRWRRVIFGTFICSGVLAAANGVLMSYSLSAASAGGLGDLLLPSIAAAMLGGVALSGGRGTPLGAAIGAISLGVLEFGLAASGNVTQAVFLYTGLVLLAVAFLDVFSERGGVRTIIRSAIKRRISPADASA